MHIENVRLDEGQRERERSDNALISKEWGLSVFFCGLSDQLAELSRAARTAARQLVRSVATYISEQWLSL